MPGSGGNSTAKEISAVLEMDLRELALPVRVINCIKTQFEDTVPTVRQVVLKSETELLRIKNFGRRSLNELKEALSGVGLHVGMRKESLPPPPTHISPSTYVYPVGAGPSCEDLADFVVRAVAGSGEECITVWVGDPFNVIDHEYHMPIPEKDLKALAMAADGQSSFEIRKTEEGVEVVLNFDPTNGVGTLTVTGTKKP